MYVYIYILFFLGGAGLGRELRGSRAATPEMRVWGDGGGGGGYGLGSRFFVSV